MKELLYLKDDQLKEFIEKISMSYRETFSDAKKVLDKYSIGVAHHKVINLISLYDGITISELLKKLKITKQSLNRVIKDLVKIDEPLKLTLDTSIQYFIQKELQQEMLLSIRQSFVLFVRLFLHKQLIRISLSQI